MKLPCRRDEVKKTKKINRELRVKINSEKKALRCVELLQ